MQVRRNHCILFCCYWDECVSDKADSPPSLGSSAPRSSSSCPCATKSSQRLRSVHGLSSIDVFTCTGTSGFLLARMTGAGGGLHALILA
jgi:hypothetical protein